MGEAKKPLETLACHDELGIPALDPLRIDQLSVIQDLNAVKVDAKIYDLDMTGISKAKLVKLSGIHNQEVELRFVIPSGGMYGPYKVKGKLLKLSIEGHGQLKLTFTNMDVGLKFKLVNKTVDGRTYFHAVKPKMTMSLTGGTANLSHLGSIANSFINWSFVTLVNAVKDTYCKPMSLIYMDKLNAMFLKVPIDDLFLQ
ncbi:protein takeout-like [Chironomus tepperi]|uniref:protein takeout-like n=1 Tax=Chironomus tepperi TaxID=113505 RepID=UPI00391FA703